MAVPSGANALIDIYDKLTRERQGNGRSLVRTAKKSWKVQKRLQNMRCEENQM